MVDAMSEKAQDTVYGVKLAQDDELVAMANEGSEFAKDAILARLPERLSTLLDLYLVAYEQDLAQVIKALGADVDRLTASDLVK